MDAEEAEAYHQAQIAAFVEGGADMITAYTLTSINEAIGVARAAQAQRIPAAISFTVETDGRLVKGESLDEAIEDSRSRDRRFGRVLHDQLRASHPFRRCVDDGGEPGRRVSMACGPMRRRRAMPSSTSPRTLD